MEPEEARERKEGKEERSEQEVLIPNMGQIKCMTITACL